MKLQLFGREDIELESDILFKDANNILLKVKEKSKFEENIDIVQHASAFQYDTIIGEIMHKEITAKPDFYLLRLEFE